MKIRSALIVLGAVAMMPFSATAEDEVICDLSTTVHIADQVGDYDATVFGNGQGTPVGDINRDAGDILFGWFSMEPTGFIAGQAPRLTANIKVADLTGLEANATFYFLWDHPTGPEAERRRFLTAQAIRPSATAPVWQFSTGYYGPLRLSGGNGYQSLGNTPGRVSVADDLIQIQVTTTGDNIPPFPANSALGFPVIDSFFLVGVYLAGGAQIPVDTAGGPCEIIQL